MIYVVITLSPLNCLLCIFVYFLYLSWMYGYFMQCTYRDVASVWWQHYWPMRSRPPLSEPIRGWLGALILMTWLQSWGGDMGPGSLTWKIFNDKNIFTRPFLSRWLYPVCGTIMDNSVASRCRFSKLEQIFVEWHFRVSLYDQTCTLQLNLESLGAALQTLLLPLLLIKSLHVGALINNTHVHCGLSTHWHS